MTAQRGGEEMANKDTIAISEKRRAHRFPAPVGTTAFIKDAALSIDKVYVRDISAVGMLVYGCYSEATYPENALIKDIIISNSI